MDTTKTFVEGRIPALDRLRVLAILILVIFHHAMIYVPDWRFHYKVETEWVWLQHLMILTSPWRMGLLWLISGIALSFMMANLSVPNALFKRTSQLLFPLLIGVLLIVPPQLYVEMTQTKQISMDYIEFTYALFFQQDETFKNFSAGIWPSIDVNHLWFLRSLWQFSVLAIIIAPILAIKSVTRALKAIAKKIWLILFVVFCIELLIQAAFTGDAVREAYGFVWFLVGFVFGRYIDFWHQISTHTNKLMTLAVMSLITLQIAFYLAGKSEYVHEFIKLMAASVYSLNRVVIPIALVAVAFKWFNQTTPNIIKLNTFVFPLYIIHQSVSIVVAFVISNYLPNITPDQHVLLSSLFLLILCFFMLRLIGSTNLLRPAFGMSVSLGSLQFTRWMQVFTFCCCIPIAFEILF